MKVLVVGGAGYIGSVLVQVLISRGHQVGVYDVMLFGDSGLNSIRSELNLVVGDIRGFSAEHASGYDAVVNLAGISSDPTAEFKPDLTMELNVEGAVHVATVCKEMGVSRYLYASSCSIYDTNSYGDEADVLLDETSAVKPTSTYAHSKLEAEHRILPMTDDQFSATSLRKGTIYGFSPRMRFDLVINTLMKDAITRKVMTLHAGGEMWRPVVHVTDAARAYAACLEADASLVAGQIFNVVYGNFRVSEMALRVREALRSIGHDSDIIAEYDQAKVRNYRVSGEHIRRSLGFNLKTGIQESVTEAVKHLKGLEATDLDSPQFDNIRWIDRLAEVDPQVDIEHIERWSSPK